MPHKLNERGNDRAESPSCGKGSGIPATSEIRPFRLWPWLLAFLAILILGNLAGIWLVREGSRDALRQAVLAMRADLLERARSFEGAIRGARSDLQFLADSPPLRRSQEAWSSSDPAISRHRRLEAQGTMLRYMDGHPEVERLVLLDPGDQVWLAVGRRASFPVLLPAGGALGQSGRGRLRWSFPFSEGEGRLVAVLHPASLLQSLAIGIGRAVLLDADGHPLAGTSESMWRIQDLPAGLLERALPGPSGTARADDWWVAAVTIAPPEQPAAEPWILARAEKNETLMAGAGSVLARHRIALAINFFLVLAAGGAVALAARLQRRRARLEQATREAERLRRLERHLLEADRLALVGRLAATVAHEVRNPLAGMRNWLALMEDEAKACGATSCSGLADRIREGIERLAATVDRTLSLARPSTRGFRPLRLEEIVSSALDMARGTPPFRGIRFEIRLQEDLPEVEGDPVLLEQLLLNLLVNARDAMEGEGVIRVRTARRGEEVLLMVEDEGPGIDPEILPRIFEPFASGKGSTGLGLAHCDMIARSHRGRLTADNPGPGGARLTLSLPAAEAGDRIAEAAVEAGA